MKDDNFGILLLATLILMVINLLPNLPEDEEKDL